MNNSKNECQENNEGTALKKIDIDCYIQQYQEQTSQGFNDILHLKKCDVSEISDYVNFILQISKSDHVLKLLNSTAQDFIFEKIVTLWSEVTFFYNNCVYYVYTNHLTEKTNILLNETGFDKRLFIKKFLSNHYRSTRQHKDYIITLIKEQKENLSVGEYNIFLSDCIYFHLQNCHLGFHYEFLQGFFDYLKELELSNEICIKDLLLPNLNHLLEGGQAEVHEHVLEIISYLSSKNFIIEEEVALFLILKRNWHGLFLFNVLTPDILAQSEMLEEIVGKMESSKDERVIAWKNMLIGQIHKNKLLSTSNKVNKEIFERNHENKINLKNSIKGQEIIFLGKVL